VAAIAHADGDGELVAAGGTDDADELLLGCGEDHGGPPCWRFEANAGAVYGLPPGLQTFLSSLYCSTVRLRRGGRRWCFLKIELILVGARVATGEPGPLRGWGDAWKAAQ
jgi:hypothetical protein